jgi:hypothetical protein
VALLPRWSNWLGPRGGPCTLTESIALAWGSARTGHICCPSDPRTLLLLCQSVPEVDPAATMPRSQSQPRTSASSYSSPPPVSCAAPQAPALSVTGPITANSEQVLVCFRATDKPTGHPSAPFQDTHTEASLNQALLDMGDTKKGPVPGGDRYKTVVIECGHTMMGSRAKCSMSQS